MIEYLDKKSATIFAFAVTVNNNSAEIAVQSPTDGDPDQVLVLYVTK